MNKAAIASVLAISSFAPGMFSHDVAAFAQMPGGQVQMDQAEFAVYDNALNKQTTPQTQAPALEEYLVKYPKSAVRTDVLQRIMLDYSQFDPTKALVAADKFLAVSPNNLQAFLIEVALRKQQAEDPKTEAATKQSVLDQAAVYAQKGLVAAQASKPAELTDEQFTAIKIYSIPTFYSVIGEGALNKKDGAAAVAAYKSELAAMKPEDLTKPAGLQETFYLAQAYYNSTPPDLINCTFYATRAAALAPDQFKPQLQPLADYCYKKFHGTKDGYDAVVTAAKANANPPADFKITPAPTDADQVNTIMSTTKEDELPKLALSDKEYILQYGTQAQADKVFDTIKGKSVEIPGAIVTAVTADQIQVAVSDDAVQSKTADFTFNMKAPLAKLPTVGDKITLSGTYASYTQKPVMITMSDSEESGRKPEKKPVARGPVRKAGPHRK
jgi:hypothetical protein